MLKARWALLLCGLLAIGAGASQFAVSTRAEGSPGAVRNRTAEGVSAPPTTASLPTGFPENSDHSDAKKSVPAKESVAKFSVTIRKPTGPPRVDLGMVDSAGKPVTAACSTCHTTRLPNLANRTPADLDEFHQLLNFAHGQVSCLSCHNPGNYDTLRLADGRSVEYADVMTLCSQCHGPQTRDYQHGAHGGMNGYWDLSRGPQTRNNCVDCHNPHAPSFPAMKPTFKPRNRFLGNGDGEKASSHE